MLKSNLPITTRKVLEYVAKQTSTCTIAISRGKDALACWLICREYFSKVIPYYTVNVPTKPMAEHERSFLDYCENFFGTKIQLFLNGDVGEWIYNYIFQPWQDLDELDQLSDIHSRKYFYYLPYLEGKPDDSWGCSGIKGCDNGLMRRMFNKRPGIREDDKTFYPVYSWSHDEVFEFLQREGMRLPSDYLCHNKTIMGLPIAPQLAWLKENIPEDFEKLKLIYPLIEAQLARNEFRKLRISR